MDRQSTPVPAPRKSLSSRVVIPPTDVPHEGQRKADTQTDYRRCRLCMRYHSLLTCPVFTAMQPQQRFLLARAHNYCTNCLALSHHTSECTSTVQCRVCGLHHHTFLHRNSGHQAAHSAAPNAASNRHQSKKKARAQRPRPPRNVNTTRTRHRSSTPAATNSPPVHRRNLVASGVEDRTIRRTATGLRTANYRGKVSQLLVQQALRALQELQETLGD
ncbi:uncharacterized protein LOC118755829 [Rhagoletis pomonella]|uniref:uncharacterized protein LOC118755829 n=1 Tax=Rhagoletis pomonella TaxID=28610 RepID=UPI00177D32D7|nr:uncharacterized protein LOC118755829 [Rhagoletis pomonella]XP_036346534.1 uncharacterized protein LOC118755829 [Rhagoletis pomonella]